MRLPYNCSRIFLFERERSSTSGGFPSRRSLVPGFLIHFRAKIRVDPWLKTSCVPASSVQIRVQPWLFIGKLFVRHIASCDSPLPTWREDEGEGILFGLANCASVRNWLESDPSPQSSPFLKGRGGLSHRARVNVILSGVETFPSTPPPAPQLARDSSSALG